MTDNPKLAALAVMWTWGNCIGRGHTRIKRRNRGTARPFQYLINVDVITRDEDGPIQFHFLLAAVMCEHVSGLSEAQDDVITVFPIEGHRTAFLVLAHKKPSPCGHGPASLGFRSRNESCPSQNRGVKRLELLCALA